MYRLLYQDGATVLPLHSQNIPPPVRLNGHMPAHNGYQKDTDNLITIKEAPHEQNPDHHIQQKEREPDRCDLPAQVQGNQRNEMVRRYEADPEGKERMMIQESS